MTDFSTGYSEILSDDGDRIGLMTPTGPIYSADPDDMDFITELSERAQRDFEKKATVRSKKQREQRMTSLLDLTMVHPNMIANSLNELTIEERRIIECALSESGDSVNLAVVVNRVSKRKELSNATKHSIEVAMGRASHRLYNRGLATVEKRADSLIWCTVSRDRVRAIISREIAARDAGGTPNFNLMKVPCEIPTFSSGQEKKKIKHSVLDMPKRASAERLAACRLLKGIRMMERADKVQINYNFEKYLSDINDKIIALLDLKSGEVIGSEYSTRFNDIAKAAAGLNKFDTAIANSFNEHSKAVFLTLTTDPNLTDGERSQIRAGKIASVNSKLANSRLSEDARKALTRQLYKLEGPDYEIQELTVRIESGTLSKDEKRKAEERLRKLESDRETAEDLLRKIDDPNTPVRTREKMITSVKKHGRWKYTYNPEGFQNLYDANRSFSPAWNKFMSYLTKKNDGIRPEYIAAYEYTESGLMHVHALIFTEFLMPNDEISREWIRCGQGEISYIYSLKAVKSRDGSGWEWRWNSQSRPHDAKGMSGADYLKKYIRKCMLAMMDDFTSPADIQSPYWALNKRMFTCSRNLQKKRERNVGEQIESENNAVFSFYRIFSSDDESCEEIDRMVYHRIRPGMISEDPPDGGTVGVVS